MAGRSAELAVLGSLRISLSSEGKEKEEDVTSDAIKRVRVIFAPVPKIKDALKNVKFEKE